MPFRCGFFFGGGGGGMEKDWTSETTGSMCSLSNIPDPTESQTGRVSVKMVTIAVCQHEQCNIQVYAF